LVGNKHSECVFCGVLWKNEWACPDGKVFQGRRGSEPDFFTGLLTLIIFYEDLCFTEALSGSEFWDERWKNHSRGVVARRISRTKSTKFAFSNSLIYMGLKTIH
jgi:hypothetical protein